MATTGMPHKRSIAAVCFSADLLPLVLVKLGAPQIMHAAAVCAAWREVVSCLDDAAPWRQLCETRSPLLAKLKVAPGGERSTWRDLYCQWLLLHGKVPLTAPRPQEFSLGLEMRCRTDLNKLLFAGMGGLALETSWDGPSMLIADVTAEPGMWPLGAWIGEAGHPGDYENTVSVTCFLLRKTDGKLCNLLPKDEDEGGCNEMGARFLWSLQTKEEMLTINAVVKCQTPDGDAAEEEEIYEMAESSELRKGSSIVGVRVETHDCHLYQILDAISNERQWV